MDPDRTTPDDEVRVARVLTDLLLDSLEMRPGELGLVAERARAAGARGAGLWLADLDQQSLHLLGADGTDDVDATLAVEGTDAGRAFRMAEVVEADGPGASGGGEDGVVLWLPLRNSAERLGVLSVELAAPPGASLRSWLAFAALHARLVATMSAFDDSLVLARRTSSPSLAAEMRLAHLPPLAISVPGMSIAGLYEPAYEIAGDTFDYAVDGGLLHIALFDAMGHGLEASRMANFTVSAYRNARRRGLSLEAIVVEIDALVASEFGDSRYVTGQVATLDLEAGGLTLIDMGHPPPVLLAASGSTDFVDCVPTLPLGLRGREPRLAQVQMQPGDQLLLFTDGVSDARSSDGERFGEQRLAARCRALLDESHPPAECLRTMVAEALDHQGGHAEDDSTLILLGWTGTGPAEGPVRG